LQLGPADADRHTAHAVLGQSPRDAAVAAADPGLTRFVGREGELAVLLDAFARTAAGRGQVAFLAGEAGIGKSRLLAELRQRLADRPHRWIEGRCASYGMATPFLPLIDGLRRQLAIDDSDDEAGARVKVEAEVARLGGDLAWTLPFVKQLLSLEAGDPAAAALDSASRRSELFRALRALLLRDAELAPLVVVIEDLHWIDPASEEWLSFVADAVPGARVLLVLTHRSGYRHPLPDRSYHVPVSLAPLSGGDMAAMTGAMLGTAQVPDDLRLLIAGKAEGNPFFVEELVQSLLEDGALRRDGERIVLTRGVDDLLVPDTVQDVLSARIDRLGEDARRAIQVASVIGREFALRLLARLTEAGERIRGQVDELRSLELIYEKALHPELAYMFKHALTHDVAYESVQPVRRQHLHVAIGRCIEELYADRLGEHYETLAHHFGRGEDWPRALLYHERSSEKAAATHATRAVREHCRQALAIADRLGAQVDADRRRLLCERLGQACYYLSEFAASGAAYEEAAALSPSPEGRALNLTHAGVSYHWAHRYDDGRRCTAEAHAVALAGDAHAARALTITLDGWHRAVLDADLEGYAHQLAEAEAICVRHPHPAVEGTIATLGLMLFEWTGQYAGAISRAERAIAIGRRLRIPDVIILPTWFLGKARACTGDYGGAIALLDEAYALCDRIGDRAWKSRLLNTLGWCFAAIGSVEQARDYNERAAALARTIGDPEILSNADINLAANHLALGDRGRASAYLEPIEAALAAPGDPWMRWRYALHVRHTRACIELDAGRPDAALPLLDAELLGARQHRAPKIEVSALIRRGATLLELERRDDAAADLTTAATLADAIGYRHGVWEAHGLLAELARRAGQLPHAATHAARAAAALQAAAASLSDEALRRRLLDSSGR
ncbi:MAG: ATP-binding protein, partial [Candidatus Binatia bacterium]